MGKECRTWEEVPIEKVNDYFHKKGPSMAWLIEDGKTIMGPTRTLFDCLKVIHMTIHILPTLGMKIRCDD